MLFCLLIGWVDVMVLSLMFNTGTIWCIYWIQFCNDYLYYSSFLSLSESKHIKQII